MFRKLFKQFFTIITLEVLSCTVGADTTDTEGTEGAGGKMGDVADFFKKGAKAVGDWGSNGWKAIGDVTEALTGSRGIAANTTDKLSEFYQNEISNKSDLRGAETETFLSGLPVVGGIIRGLEGVNQLEDLYNRTGKLPAYPGLGTTGASGIGSALGQLTRKIENGSNSLHEFYSGEPEVDPNQERMFRYMSENWNVRRGAI